MDNTGIMKDLDTEIHCATCGRDDAHRHFPEAAFVRVTSHQPPAPLPPMLGQASLEVIREPPLIPELGSSSLVLLGVTDRLHRVLRSYQVSFLNHHQR